MFFDGQGFAEAVDKWDQTTLRDPGVATPTTKGWKASVAHSRLERRDG